MDAREHVDVDAVDSRGLGVFDRLECVRIEVAHAPPSSHNHAMKTSEVVVQALPLLYRCRLADIENDAVPSSRGRGWRPILERLSSNSNCCWVTCSSQIQDPLVANGRDRRETEHERAQDDERPHRFGAARCQKVLTFPLSLSLDCFKRHLLRRPRFLECGRQLDQSTAARELILNVIQAEAVGLSIWTRASGN